MTSEEENHQNPPPQTLTPRPVHKGVRALTNLLLLEHDFRRAQEDDQLARLVVDKLKNFAPYDCAVFWTVKQKKYFRKAVISGVGNEPDGKAMRKWGVQLSRWLAKEIYQSKQALLIEPDVIADKVLNCWPETVPMHGLAVPIKNPKGDMLGGVILLREAAWSPAVQVLLDQMAEAAGYSLRAISLGMHKRKPNKAKWLTFGLIGLLMAGSFLIPMPVNIDVRAELAKGNPSISGLSAPRGPAQIDLMIPAQEAMNLKPGMRLEANFSGQKYKLEVERVTPWYVALFSDRRVRTRLIDAPDDLAPPVIERVTVSNTTTPLPLYLLRGPVNAIRQSIGLK